MKFIKYDQKHLTLEQRNIIEQGLNANLSLNQIASSINKDPSTVSKEIKRNRIKKEANTHNSKNICALVFNCHLKDICNSNCSIECRTCELCNQYCKDFIPYKCKRLFRFPYTCNSCSKKSPCRLEKYYYKALHSFNSYKTILSSSRQGISLSEEELCSLDSIVSPLVKQGHSLSSIFTTHNLNCSKASLYNYVEKRYLSIGNLDLPRKVRFRKRKNYTHHTKDTSIRLGRTYQDFLDFIALNPDYSIVEMDTVEGKKGGKVLLTLLFRKTKLMLCFLMDDKSTNSVLHIFNYLENILGYTLFKQIFSVILTDNGSEFSDPVSLELSISNDKRTNIFYCDASAPYQKGALEKNHEFIRYIIPKGISMNNFTQDDILLMTNHINSYPRASLNWITPFGLSELLIGKEVLKKLNLSIIPNSEIKLTTKLLKKN